MRTDDKRIRKVFRELKVPVSYEERVDSLLKSKPAETEDKEPAAPRKKGKYIFRAAVCALCVCLLFTVTVFRSNADFLDDLKRTLMDFFGFSTAQDGEESGVHSKPLYVGSKRDLIVELREAVISAHNIYILVRITAPTDVTFTEYVGFEYFGFCTGENYDVNNLLGGSRDCRLLETGTEMPNEALYVVSLTFDQEVSEGTPVTCFLQNLSVNPYEDRPDQLVKGIWSLTFPFEQTVVESVSVEGNPNMIFPYIDGSAVIEHLELTPLGINLLLDVSGVTYDLMNVSDTTVSIKLLYVDGSKKTIVSHNDGESFIQGGSISYSTLEDKVTQQHNLEFTEILNIEQVIGVYIEDLYVPLH